MTRHLLAWLFLALSVGFSFPAAAQDDSCRGKDLRFEAVRNVCVARDGQVSDPLRHVLSARILADDLTVRTGEAISVRVELRNETDEPLELFLSRVGSFEVSLLDGDVRIGEENGYSKARPLEMPIRVEE